MPMRWLLQALSPPAARARLSILIFHRVLPVPDPLFPGEVDAAQFESICTWLRQWCNVLPLDQACRRLHDGTLPARAAAITFDDGYSDNHDIALPILRRHGLTATFFVATGFLDGGRMWNDTLIESVRRSTASTLDLSTAGVPGLGRLPLSTLADRRAAIAALIGAVRYLEGPERNTAVAAVARAAAVDLPDDLMMTSEQVRSLHRQAMAIGGHTVNHPILCRLPLHEARSEIAAGKKCLEEITQAPVTVFAYPNGRPGQDFAAEHAALAEELGFAAAVTTAWGAADSRTHRFQLPRFTPWDRSRWAFGLRLARNLGLRVDPRVASKR